ncbi:MAG: TRAP transporter small permease [Selenomonadaceae bacterium]|nr:TRAP transporter small permease [Selenomonadaceae bacterium]MBR1579633.1 TRAP transporter small permease [Selenomonadaceae bacterium]
MRSMLAKIEDIICAIALGFMTILTFANVVARYVFSASFSFSEEITTYLFVLLSLIGSAAAARRKAHLGFTAILDLMSSGVKRAITMMSYTLAFLFSSALFYYGLNMVSSQMRRGQVTAGMQWPEWIFGAFVPLGAFFIALEFLFLLLDTIAGKEDAK